MDVEVIRRICHDWQSALVNRCNGDEIPPMDRSSKTITLALIGSAFLLGGCQDQEQQEAQQNQQTTQNGSGGARGVYIAPRIGGGYGGGGAGGGVSSAPSVRGGFGSTGSVGGSVGVGS
jgi:hypothetical protein